jgi:hypothetical protein
VQPHGGEALPSSAPTLRDCAAVGPPVKAAGRAEGARSGGEKGERKREKRGWIKEVNIIRRLSDNFANCHARGTVTLAGEMRPVFSFFLWFAGWHVRAFFLSPVCGSRASSSDAAPFFSIFFPFHFASFLFFFLFTFFSFLPVFLGALTFHFSEKIATCH